ncbi:MAG TPA: hypothetical protein ENK57_12040 [Polyangiaceae bacterium]|nr:hypothetical protein [Polyangiaceae bacterium]
MTPRESADREEATVGREPLKCPKCGAPEVEAFTPRTVYACGASDYDQRPGTGRPCGSRSVRRAAPAEEREGEQADLDWSKQAADLVIIGSSSAIEAALRAAYKRGQRRGGEHPEWMRRLARDVVVEACGEPTAGDVEDALADAYERGHAAGRAEPDPDPGPMAHPPATVIARYRLAAAEAEYEATIAECHELLDQIEADGEEQKTPTEDGSR